MPVLCGETAGAAFRRRAVVWASLLVACGSASPSAAQVTLTEGTNISADVSAVDGRLAMNLLGSIWLVPSAGGLADKIVDNLEPATSPRWSPDGRFILYQAGSPLGTQLRMYDTTTRTSADVGSREFSRDADWHPDGRRLVLSSQSGPDGFDIREWHLATGLGWRLTHHPGDETWPAWSADGLDLAYIHELNGEWRLVLRRRGRSEQTVLRSAEPLAAPSWRPDGSLLTFFRRQGETWSMDIAILSDPPIVRTLAGGEDFFMSPVSWFDRQLFYYTADGTIKERRFNDQRSRPLTFRAEVGAPAPRPAIPATPRRIEIDNPPRQRLVVRARRLFDGDSPGYREAVDVIIADGRIEAVRPRAVIDDDAILLDLGEATILPGFIDVYADLPPGDERVIGSRLLSFGVTTIVADRVPDSFRHDLWNSPETPGPRLLRARPVTDDEVDRKDTALATLPASGVTTGDARELIRRWQSRGVPVLAESPAAGLLIGADLLLGAEHSSPSPAGRRYADLGVAASHGDTTMVSTLAAADTPGLASLLASRQAGLLAVTAGSLRPFSAGEDLRDATSSVVVGSKSNGLPAGLALHAELRALAAAGLDGDRVLEAVGANAAAALGYSRDLGRIVPGAVADLVIVAGDPRQQVAAALDIVAVVHDGRFYSLVRLLEQAGAPRDVE